MNAGALGLPVHTAAHRARGVFVLCTCTLSKTHTRTHTTHLQHASLRLSVMSTLPAPLVVDDVCVLLAPREGEAAFLQGARRQLFEAELDEEEEEGIRHSAASRFVWRAHDLRRTQHTHTHVHTI